MKSPKEGNFCSISWRRGPCRSLIRVSQSGVRELGYLCHHTYQAMGEGCPLEARGPQNLLAPQCIGKGGSSSLRETEVQALERENTLEALSMKQHRGLRECGQKLDTLGHNPTSSPLAFKPLSTLITAWVLLNPTLVVSCSARSPA